MKKAFLYPTAVPFLLLCPFTSGAVTDALRIKIASPTYSDETVIRFMPGASNCFEGCCDAFKLFSPNNAVPNVFTRSCMGEELTINALPPLNAPFSADLFLRIGINAVYSFKTEEIGAFAEGICITMLDKTTGYMYNLRDTALTHSINLPLISMNDAARFRVFFSLPATVQVQNASCKGCADGGVTIYKPGESGWFYAILDSAAGFITSGSAGSDTAVVTGFFAGNYTAVVNASFSFCTDSLPFTIETPVVNECSFDYADGEFVLNANFSAPESFKANIIFWHVQQFLHGKEGKILWCKKFINIKQADEKITFAHTKPGVYISMVKGENISLINKTIIGR